jgi:hypothetical protein
VTTDRVRQALASVTDPDFAPLRGREDFQKLIAQIATDIKGPKVS